MSLKRRGQLERPFLVGAKYGFAHFRTVASESFIEFLEAADRRIERAIGSLRPLDKLDETLARDRAEVRESVLRAREEWPFELPAKFQ